MRLLTAIPLLIWASTSAVACFAASLWVAEPAVVVQAGTDDEASPELARPSGQRTESTLASVLFELAPAESALRVPELPAAAPESPSSTPQPEFALSRILLANPPPAGV